MSDCRTSIRVVTVGGFLMSFVCGLFPAVLALVDRLPGVEPTGLSLFVGAGSLSQIVLSLVSGFVLRHVGMRRMVVFSAVLFVASAVLLALPCGHMLPLLAGNVARGMAFGIVTAVSPLLIVEGLDRNRRRSGSAWYQFSMQCGGVVGALAGAIVVNLAGEHVRLALSLDFALILLLSAVFLCVAVRLPTEGARTEASRRFEGWALCRHWRRVLLAVLFMSVMSACGVGTVRNYLVILLEGKGFAGASANLMDTAIGLASVVAVLLTTLLADRVSRRTLLRFGGVLIVIGHVGAACTGGLCFGAFVALSSVAFAMGFGVCAWVVVPEILPAEVRAPGLSVALLAGQLTTFAALTLFPLANQRFGLTVCLLAFAALTAATLPFFGIISRER